MALDYDTDLKVVLQKGTDLYKWSLKETDSKDNKIGSDFIPFFWTLNFHSTSFIVQRGISSQSPIDSEDDESNISMNFSQNDVILVNLKSGFYGEEGLRVPSISMFGSSREVENILLRIHRIEDVKKENCRVSGGVAYEWENDFRIEREEDWIEITLKIESKKFDSLFYMVLNNNIEHLSLRLNEVDGIYSNWSPSIHTNFVKALGNIEDQGLEVGEDWKDRIPTLGKVGEASLTIQRSFDAKLPGRVDPCANEQSKKIDDGNARSIALDPLRDQIAVQHSLYEMWFRRIYNLLIVIVAIELFRAFSA